MSKKVCLFSPEFEHFLKWQRNESSISANYHAQETTHGYHHHHDSIIIIISNNLEWIRFELNCKNRFVCFIWGSGSFQTGKGMRAQLMSITMLSYHHQDSIIISISNNLWFELNLSSS